jgi:hypothetical protein
MTETPGPREPPTEDAVFGGINLLVGALRDTDDRGLILSLSAFAEDALGVLLKSFMLPLDATTQLLDGFNAPLGTLSSRIKAAFALGLVTNGQFQDLERLRKIRNAFAHTWRPVSLNDPKVLTTVQGMSYSRIDQLYPSTPADKVRSSITCLLVELRSMADQVSKKGMRLRESGTHLMAGFPGANFKEQFEAAHVECARIHERVTNSTGEEQQFYRILLTKLRARLEILRPAEPHEKEGLAALIARVQRELARVPE